MQRAEDPIYPSQCVLSIFFATGEAVNDIGSEAKDFNRSFVIVRSSYVDISETYWISGFGWEKRNFGGKSAGWWVENGGG